MLFTIRLSAAFLTLVLAVPLPALAANDWSIPCTQGKCSWDLPADSGSSGSLQIWGSVNAISDITLAAGWRITTTCNMTSPNQVIQLVCEDNNPDCNHLFQGNGAVNTIVRLPESCGPNPFARVALHQMLQSNVVTRDNGSEVPIHQLTLDGDFTATSPSQGDEVNFSLQAQNWQGDSNTVNRRNRRRSRPLARLSTEAPIDLSGDVNLYRDGSGSIDVDINIQASVDISVVASGTVIPPEITEFGIEFAFDGNAGATLGVSGDLAGQVNPPPATLYSTGISGISIPLILDVGPEFALLGVVQGNFGLQHVNAAVGVNYALGGASFIFPPQSGSNTNGITSSSTLVKFSADLDIGETFDLTVGIVPQVSVGLSALSGLVSASVFLNFEASLDLDGSISSTTNPEPCLSGGADINVEVGAKGTFFGLFNPSAGISLYNKNFPLFQQCFP